MEEKITIETLAGMMKKEFNEIGGRFDKMDSRFDKVGGRLDKIESTMVTKDYLDEKIADLRGDLVVMMRKEDTKVVKLVEVLKRHKVISDSEEREILSMEPFAKMFV